ncbi:MAG TPA: YitT family protein [Candidatus Aphodocola excrementigallinarum]|uniref:YitT family protein n=1 Tax=Candidatus Aphodocola excrementigallinarum TaxID=2840670 RepID=A0A9D1ILQ5_9FIRM|nr:YitT family protein [Candidatus Aphodocola excrementigallinarum]
MRLFRKLKEKKAEKVLKVVETAHLFKRYVFLLIGISIYALAYNLFFYKNNIVYGGASGISIITQNLIDPSKMILILNVFFIILSFIFLGRKKTLGSLVGSLLYPIMVKLTANVGDYIQIENDNLLLIAIVGGVCVGTAVGIVFKSGFTTGGTDILNQIVAKYFKVSIGTSMLMTDGIIVLVGGFFFGWTRVLYAIIVLYIINIMVDKVVLGISSGKAVYITTKEDDLVCDYLLNELKLGITLIETRGGYTNKKDQIILCVVPTSEYFKVREGVQQIDKNAVILVTDAYQTLGTYSGNTSII